MYYGEFSRALKERAKEQLGDARGVLYHMAKHLVNAHPDIEKLPAFQEDAEKIKNSCFSQVLISFFLD